MRIVIFLLFICFCYPSKTFLISDEDYTNQDFNRDEVIKFLNSFERCRLSIEDKETIYRNAKYFKINVLVVMARMQCETDLIEIDNQSTIDKYNFRYSMAMSYGVMDRYIIKDRKKYHYIYWGYNVQVLMATSLMAKTFKEFNHNKKITLLDTDQVIKPDNAGTYSLYVYNPYFGKHKKFKGQLLSGNIIFRYKFLDYKKKWEEINGKKNFMGF